MEDPDRERRQALTRQERMASLDPVLRALPSGTQVAILQEGDQLLLFNVTQAIELFGNRPPTAVITVAHRAKQIGSRDTETPSDDQALIDPAHAASVDLSYPILLLASHDELDGSPGRVIDGWHRIYRAAQLGIEELPAIVLTAEEEALIRIESQLTEP